MTVTAANGSDRGWQAAVGVGALLIVVGLASRFLTGTTSVTALIPAFFGTPIVVLGWLARAPERRRTMMHIVAALALLGMLGTFSTIPEVIGVLGGQQPANPTALAARTTMLVPCGGLLAFCVSLFVQARRAR